MMLSPTIQVILLNLLFASIQNGLTEEQCVSSSFKCDEKDCPNGEDKLNCTGKLINVTELELNVTASLDCDHMFLCHDGLFCVPSSYQCDGMHDCEDYSDEENCVESNRMCWHESHAFLCDNHATCIYPDSVCDGHQHCKDGTDELNNCYEECKNLSCEHRCGIVSGSVKCSCREGLEIDAFNSSLCIDIDECTSHESLPLCSQLCHNTYGSYYCSCHRGYEKTSHGNCKTMGDESTLYFATKDKIVSLGHHKRLFHKLLEHQHGITRIETDAVNKKIFWIELNYKHMPGIYYLDLAQPFRTKTPFITFGLIEPHDLAFDYLGNNVYITDKGSPSILACSVKISACVSVVNETMVSRPTDIELFPQEGLMYWIESEEATIFQGRMDGSSISVFLLDLGSPHTLHLDLTSKQLFWIDDLYSLILSIHLDGTNKKALIQHMGHTNMLFVFEDNIYFMDADHLLAANKFTGLNQKQVLQDVSMFTSVVISHPSLQINDEEINPCQSSNCSHIYLIGDNNTCHCACPNGFVLDSQASHCYKAKTHLLLAAHKNEILKLPLHLPGILELTTVSTKSMRHVEQLAYLTKSDEILYTDVTKDGLWTMNVLTNISSQAKSQVVFHDVSNVSSLVVDESFSIIYWINRYKHEVHLLSLKSQHSLVLKIDHVDQPHALAIEPTFGLLFVAEHSYPSEIFTCYQDGTSCTSLVSDLLHPPDSMHYYQGRLYYTDYYDESISSVNVDGTGLATVALLINRRKSLPTSMVVFEDIIFWTEINSDYIFCQHLIKYNAGQCQIETHKFNLTGLVVVASESEVHTACSLNNGGCDHICVPVPHNISCLCSDGYVLQVDLRTCIKHHGSVSCEGGQGYLCKNGRCISQKLFCDDEDDCGDNSDEEGQLCTGHMCKEDEHKCSSNRCVPMASVCNGIKDCHDGSDEASCTHLPPHCKQSELSCSLSCIGQDAVCDGYKDCINGEDEKNCSQKLCSADQYQCSDGQCISNSSVCDDVLNCLDGDDESKCTHQEISYSDGKECMGFRCENGQCIENFKTCDGSHDCKDGSDEFRCQVDCKSFSLCSQICLESSNGPQCACRQGFQLVGRTLCDDIDECKSENGGCSQKCLNRKGGHQCWCVAGYTLALDQQSCKANGPRPYLILGTHLGIKNISLSRKQNQMSIETYSPPIHMDVNVHNGEIFWTEFGKLQNMFIASSKNMRRSTMSDIHGLAVDWVTNNIYTAEVFNYKGKIKVYNGKGYEKTLISEMKWKPCSIALHPNTSMMYWLTYHKLEKSWMDGLQRTDVVLMSTEGWPVGLTIDHPAERLYWLYPDTGNIETCKFDGTNRFSIPHQMTHKLNSFDVFEGLAYLTDETDGAIIRLSTYSLFHREPKIKIETHSGPIKIVHKLKQPIRDNGCQDLNCMFLCVLIPYGARCLCYDGYENNTDKECAGVHSENSNVHKAYDCLLQCQNGGLCTIVSGVKSCSCLPGFSGNLCQHMVQSDVASLSWLAGVLVTVVILFLIIIALVIFVRFRRKSKLFMNTIRFTDPKFTSVKFDDEEGLVQEVSFSETNSPNHVKNTKELEWWKKIIKAKKPTVSTYENITNIQEQERQPV